MSGIEQRMAALEAVLAPPVVPQNAELILLGPDDKIEARYFIPGFETVVVHSAIPRSTDTPTATDDSPGET